MSLRTTAAQSLTVMCYFNDKPGVSNRKKKNPTNQPTNQTNKPDFVYKVVLKNLECTYVQSTRTAFRLWSKACGSVALIYKFIRCLISNTLFKKPGLSNPVSKVFEKKPQKTGVSNSWNLIYQIDKQSFWLSKFLCQNTKHNNKQTNKQANKQTKNPTNKQTKQKRN